MRFG
ncbi:Protein of unknown function [Bacillus cereus]|jgi:hypothetical protein